MNRKEAIEIIKNSNIHGARMNGKNLIIEAINELAKDITLADLLGWEEGVEYEADGHKFRIKNDSLVILERNDDYWGDFDYAWDIQNINWLRQATKVESKPKAYHVKDEYSYDCLMKELEEKGHFIKFGGKPTNWGAWSFSNKDMIIYGDKDLTWDMPKHAETDNYDLIEYHKEEPNYYAKIKGTEIYMNHIDYTWGGFTTIEGRAINMTKSEWNELGINDSNAEFEKVQE